MATMDYNVIPDKKIKDIVMIEVFETKGVETYPQSVLADYKIDNYNNIIILKTNGDLIHYHGVGYKIHLINQEEIKYDGSGFARNNN